LGPYTQWPERFPPLQRGVLAAAECTGAPLMVLENLSGYGPEWGQADDRGSPTGPRRPLRAGPSEMPDEPMENYHATGLEAGLSALRPPPQPQDHRLALKPA